MFRAKGGVITTYMYFIPQMSLSKLTHYLKGINSRILVQELARFRKQFWGRHIRERDYMATSSSNITDTVLSVFIRISINAHLIRLLLFKKNEITFSLRRLWGASHRLQARFSGKQEKVRKSSASKAQYLKPKRASGPF